MLMPVWLLALDANTVDSPALTIAFGIVIVGALALLVVHQIRRRIRRRAGTAGDGKWWRGPHAPQDKPFIPPANRDQSR